MNLNRILISESEKNRILGLHNSTKKNPTTSLIKEDATICDNLWDGESIEDTYTLKTKFTSDPNICTAINGANSDTFFRQNHFKQYTNEVQSCLINKIKEYCATKQQTPAAQQPPQQSTIR